MPIIFEPLQNNPGPSPQSACSGVHPLRGADPSSCN